MKGQICWIRWPVLVKVKVAIEVLVVMKMVLIEVDHAINVEGDREAAKVANLVHKELSDEVRGHLAVHHVGLLLYRLVYHLVHNHPQHYLTLSRCHIKILSVYLEKLSWPAGVSSGVHITKELFIGIFLTEII